mgnify:CR=1 FL=1
MEKGIRAAVFAVTSWLLAATATNATGAFIPIESSSFTASPSSKGEFLADGSARLFEDDFFGTTLLTNAPPVDAQVIAALPGTILAVDYRFQWGATDSDDRFSAVLLGDGLATSVEQIIDEPGSGVLRFDLDALRLTGVSALGIEFALTSAFDNSYGSSLVLSDLQTLIPSPGSLVLLGGGLVYLWQLRRSRRPQGEHPSVLPNTEARHDPRFIRRFLPDCPRRTRLDNGIG